MADNVPSSPRSRPGMGSGYSPPSSPGRQSDYLSSSSSRFMKSTPLPIRNAPTDVVPPPLPPPTHPPILATSRSAWSRFQHNPSPFSRSVVRGSSLEGTWISSSERPSVPRKAGILMSQDPLHEADSPVIKKEEDELNLLPVISGNFKEQHSFESQNHKKATEAYDKQQLSKLGRPKTPVRSSTQGSIDNSPLTAGRLRLDTQAPMHKLTHADRSIGSESPLRASPPLARWAQQSHSGTLSPGMVSSAASSRSHAFSELRSPPYEPSTAPSSFATDRHDFSRVGSIDRGSNASLSLLSNLFDDPEREMKRAGHVSSSADAELDPDFAGLRSRHADVRENAHHWQFDVSMAGSPSLVHHTHSPGIKRKASQSDTHNEEPAAQAARSRTPGRSVKRTSPTQHANGLQSSFASATATTMHGSPHPSTNLNLNLNLSSSALCGVAPQENTTAQDTYDTLDARHRQPPFVSSRSLDHEERALIGHDVPCAMGERGQTGSVQQREAANGASGSEVNADPLKPPLANIHMCNCCPKKPKKFPTYEALQAHQNEKQYYCSYCHNRFKNKNEAERHQNSLHLRKQSWSCAALENRYEKAFHPCTAVPSASGTQALPVPSDPRAESDVCGYCGKRFANFPSPDWGERSKHLTEAHKFGECNQAKKFFRADHFRQHLKHSHGGVAGKWTNMLESACLKDEPLPQPLDRSVQEALHQPQQYQQQSQLQASQALQAVQQQPDSSATPTLYQINPVQQSATSPTSPSEMASQNVQAQQGFAIYSGDHATN